MKVEIADLAGADEGDHECGVGGAAAAVGVDHAAREVDFSEEVVLVGGDQDAATVVNEGVLVKVHRRGSVSEATPEVGTSLAASFRVPVM